MPTEMMEPGPDSKPMPEPKPEAKPEAKPVGPATPAPDPKPEPAPKPEPKPEPPPAKPVPRPSREDIAALSKALETARTALGEQHYDVAKTELAKAATLAKLPGHVARVERLQMLSHYAQEFRAALRDAVKKLKAGEAITVKNTTVGVVETFPNEDKIILRIAGMNRTYRFEDLPIGLAVALADMWLDQKQPGTLIIKASYVLAHKSATDEMRQKARQWLDEAKGNLPELVLQLLPVLDDRYDNLQKEVDALPAD